MNGSRIGAIGVIGGLSAATGRRATFKPKTTSSSTMERPEGHR